MNARKLMKACYWFEGGVLPDVPPPLEPPAILPYPLSTNTKFPAIAKFSTIFIISGVFIISSVSAIFLFLFSP